MAHRNDWATGLFATSPRGARRTPVGFPLPCPLPTEAIEQAGIPCRRDNTNRHFLFDIKNVLLKFNHKSISQ
jgi:hypothetical protein